MYPIGKYSLPQTGGIEHVAHSSHLKVTGMIHLMIGGLAQK
jgi:hypothetical protein